MIRCDNVHVTLSGRAVLQAISVEAKRGEAIVVVGRNAAGKTTLLRAMAGLLPLSRGTIAWDGVAVASLSPAARAKRLAFVPQRPQVSARFTVRETIELGRFSLPPNQAAIDTAIERVGLTSLADRPYHELSVGQQQRVALGRAFAQVAADGGLLLDEPFAAMDLGETDRCLRLLRAHARAGGTVIAVVHDLAQAVALADQVWMLEEGRLVDAGTQEVVLAPAALAARFGVAFTRGGDGVPHAQFGR